MEVRVFSWMLDSPHLQVDIPLTSILANSTPIPILKNLGPQHQVKFLIHGFADGVKIENKNILSLFLKEDLGNRPPTNKIDFISTCSLFLPTIKKFWPPLDF